MAETPLLPADFLEWQRRSTSFQAMNAWSGASFNVSTDERPEQVGASRRTPGFFTMEGLPMLLGRDFLPEEGQPGNDRVVILSHRLWSGHFNSNRDLIGKPIRMNGEPYTVVGVLQPGTYDRFNSQLWVPLSFKPEQIAHDSNYMPVMARLKDDVTIAQAQAEMDGIAAQLQNEQPRTNANRGVSVEPLHLNFVTDSTRRNLWLLLGAVGFLLLIGCVNVANLLLARGTARQREVALRAALGATRSRLFTQFLTESLILAVIGGALGVLLAGVIVDAIEMVMPPVGTMLPSEANIRISIPVLVFTIGVTTFAGLLFGAAPALTGCANQSQRRLETRWTYGQWWRTPKFAAGVGGYRVRFGAYVTRDRRVSTSWFLEPDANRSWFSYRECAFVSLAGSGTSSQRSGSDPRVLPADDRTDQSCSRRVESRSQRRPRHASQRRRPTSTRESERASWLEFSNGHSRVGRRDGNSDDQGT